MPVAEVRVGDGAAILTLRGDIDLAVAATISERVAEALSVRVGKAQAARPERLVIDMAQVSFIDCAGARAILGAQQHLPDGQRPVLRHAGPEVLRLLNLTGLDEQFRFD
jgi:anti-anti-sigma factor